MLNSAGQDFTQRYLVRRPVDMYVSASGSPSTPAALEALSVWAITGNERPTVWASTGPVVPAMGAFAVTAPALALLATSPTVNPNLVGLQECALSGAQPTRANSTFVLTAVGECGASDGPFSSGSVVRPAGWVAPSAADAEVCAWIFVGVNRPRVHATMQVVGAGCVCCLLPALSGACMRPHPGWRTTLPPTSMPAFGQQPLAHSLTLCSSGVS
jgi:hypothetical protein